MAQAEWQRTVRAVRKVVVLGGGVAGLSCAHELRRADVEVDVYEAGHALGGKARTHYLRGTGTEGRTDLPGEHGFRFYPSFYLHLTETMREIPDPLSPTGDVAGNLTAAPEAGIATAEHGVVGSPRRPRTFRDLRKVVRSATVAGGTFGDIGRYALGHVQWLTSCDARRDDELEHMAWARFIGIDRPGRYSEAFRRVLLSTTRTMVAMDAETSSARTVGLASSLLMLDSIETAGDVDRTMMGPTSECWFDPWERALGAHGVRFHFGHRVVALEVEGGRIARAVLRRADGERVVVEADVFVLAVPLEAAVALATDALATTSPAFAELRRIDLDRTTSWMTGVQLYLKEDLPLVEGHLFFPGSPWGLTGIAQAQFWNRGARGMHRYGDGRLRGILSIDVSSCHEPDEDGVRLVDVKSREEVVRRVIHQLSQCMTRDMARVLERSVYAAHVDDELTIGEGGVQNAARLLIHPPGSRFQRPGVESGLPNLLLAADYVRSEIDLASMEGANEAGRRAATAVLDRFGLDTRHIRLFTHSAIAGRSVLRRLDALAWRFGQPHPFDVVRTLVRRPTATP